MINPTSLTKVLRNVLLFISSLREETGAEPYQPSSGAAHFTQDITGHCKAMGIGEVMLFTEL